MTLGRPEPTQERPQARKRLVGHLGAGSAGEGVVERFRGGCTMSELEERSLEDIQYWLIQCRNTMSKLEAERHAFGDTYNKAIKGCDVYYGELKRRGYDMDSENNLLITEDAVRYPRPKGV